MNQDILSISLASLIGVRTISTKCNQIQMKIIVPAR